ncbi:MAG: hypothetical protein JSV52_07550 [Candidatus Zixiibacteriota bacterium]|nr:MAG: hypothetical protein JSV52_07550 [candidate division Zixibacteria bacterium]
MIRANIHKCLVAFALLVYATAATAQVYNPFNQRDNEYRLLGLKRAKQAYDAVRAEYERQQQLFEKGMITSLDLEQSRARFYDAEVNYQQSLLAVLFEEQHVSVARAVKYQTADDSKHVRLTIANTSGGTAEFQQLLRMDDELLRTLQPDVIHNVYVSIQNDDRAIISRPYEAKISQLRFDEPVRLDFELLQDLDAVTIFLYYANGAQRYMKVFLEKDASVDRVAVQSEQFSQEVELGTSSAFDLTMELFSGTSNTFSLEVVNLPQQIGRFFKDPAGQVRLSQVKFTQGNRTKRAALEVSLPDRPSSEVLMDKPIPFYVLVLPREKIDGLTDLRERMWTETELDSLEVGYVRLELIPRGKGEITVRAPQLYHAINAGGTAEMYVDLVNEGSNRLDNIELNVDLPLGWSRTVEPRVVPSLEINEEARIVFTFIPPEDVAVGKYQVRIRTSGLSNSEPVTAEDKTVTIEVKPRASLAGTLTVVVLLIGLVTGVVVFGIRLSRR